MLPFFEIGGRVVPTFPLALLAAAIGGASLVLALSHRKDMGLIRPGMVLILCALGTFIGAKILSVLSMREFYVPGLVDRPGFDLWIRGGFSAYGGLIGGLLASLAAAPAFKLPVPGFIDILGTSSYLVLAISKVGCLLKGCCYGKPTLFFIALEFHDFESAARPIGVPLHATQVYEMAAAALFFAVLVIALLLFRRRGIVFALSLMLYPAARFFIEFLRGEKMFIIAELSFNQWISLTFVFAGGIIVIFIALFSGRARSSAVSGAGLLLFLFIFPVSSGAGCNRHKVLPPALCRNSGDCINGERCVDGKCVFRDILEFEVRFLKIYARPLEGDLIVEAVRVGDESDVKIMDDARFGRRISFPEFPLRVRFGKVPRGKYRVTACIDADGNGICRRPDPGDVEMVTTRMEQDEVIKAEPSILVIKYKLPE